MHVCVIGAGLSGLAAAHELHAHGHDVFVLERSTHKGGNVRTIQEEGYLIEAGPNTLQVNDPEIEKLLERWGLLKTALEANPEASRRYIVKDGLPCAVPTSPLEALRSPLFPLSGKLRLLREPFIPPSTNPNESLASFVKRRLGQSFLDYAIDPMVGGVYAGDPAQLSVRHAFPKVWNLEQQHESLIRGAVAKMRERKRSGSSFRTRLLSWPEGMEALPRALAQGLSCHHSVEITSIEHKRQLWHIGWRANGQEHFQTAEKLIVAIPAFAISALPLPSSVHTALKRLHHIAYPSVSMLALGFRRDDIAHALDGFGMLVPEVEKKEILGTLFSSTLFPGRAPEGHALLTTFIGGTRQPENARLNTPDLKALVQRDLETLLGVKAQPTFHKHIYWERAIPQYTCDYDQYLKAIEDAETSHPGLHLAGNYRGGIAAGKCLMQGVACAHRVEQEK